MLELILGMAHAALFGAFIRSALYQRDKQELIYLILYAIFSFLMMIYCVVTVAGKMT
ncbi:hypothetical protein LVJ85_02275 [Neisseria sp. Dent CA1/247]|uniref:hypothetical protein n=1 Tax=Neisseria sp. Dent CA1/247 TaxID=2912675 RepID=UPI001FD1C5F8|nr:hypothetical protein [Neisseria sp. Dent CA1/247]UOO77348.1 hypothetical protein LVJ85_02275 [Neisseria sp. Dent CA1/247]